MKYIQSIGFHIVIAITLAFISPACQKIDLKFNPEANCKSNTICISLSANTAPADGVSVIKVAAYIPAIADKENRTIIFSTNTGSFKSEANQQKPEVIADTGGKAETELTVGTIPGTYTITASVKVGAEEFNISAELELTVPTSSTLSLALEPNNTAPADGKSYRILKVTVPAALYNGTNKIKFIAGAAGVFEDPSDLTKPNQTEVLILPDLQATAKLKVGTTAGVYTIRAELPSIPIHFDQEELTLIALQTDEVIKFDFGNFDIHNLRADGFTTIPTTITIQGIETTNKKVKLEALGGLTFDDQMSSSVELPLDNHGQSSVILKVGQMPVSCTFRATIDQFSKQEYVVLGNANPSLIDLIPTPDSIKAQGGSVIIQGYFKREVGHGKVSVGTPVYFEAFQGMTQIFGFVPPEGKTDENEQVKIEFRTPSNPIVIPSLPIMIKAKAKDDTGIDREDVIFLRVY